MDKALLEKALKDLKPALSTRGIVEEFGSYVFTGKRIIAYNDQICISCPFKTPFEISVDGEDLQKTLASIDAPTFDMKLEGDTLHIVSEDTNSVLNTRVDSRATPFIESLNLEEVLEKGEDLPEDFLTGFLLCSFSASSQFALGVLTCINIDDDIMVTTDRLRISTFKLSKGIGRKLLIPASSALRATHYNLSKFHNTDSWVHFFNNDGFIFSSRVIAGDYPENLLDFFEGIEGTELELPDITSSIDKIVFMTEGDTDTKVWIDVKSTGEELILKAAKTGGWITKKVPFKSEAFHFSVNPLFLKEILLRTKKMILGKNSILFKTPSFKQVIYLASNETEANE